MRTCIEIGLARELVELGMLGQLTQSKLWWYWFNCSGLV